MAVKTVISYKDAKVRCWSVPQFLPGSGEETRKDFAEAIKRIGKAGKIDPAQEGLEAYAIAEFDDNTGKFKLFEEPEYIVTLTNEGE